MTIYPEFTQNTDNSTLLYFNSEGKNTKELSDELDKIYVCYSKMTVTQKDGQKYVVLEIPQE